MLITNIIAREILDSRGIPTLEAEIHLNNGIKSRAAVPSGASTGSKEAVELRDKDLNRFNGKGLLNNINLIDKIIKPALLGKNVTNQTEIDDILIKLDGTSTKSNLGGNTTLAISLAVAKSAAKSKKIPLFQYIGHNTDYILPLPLINIINGGKHADNLLDLQEFMIAPIKATSFIHSMQIASEIFYALKDLLIDKGYNTNYGDEGGFAPNVSQSTNSLDLIMEACKHAGYEAGKDIFIAIDAAASEFYDNNYYYLKGYNKKFTSSEMIDYYTNLVNHYPIYSLEDPIAEDDIEGWSQITNKLGSRVQIVGDDLFVTNPKIFQHGIEKGLANAILIKPNQIGALSETLETINIAKKNHYKTIISHRSGETEDTTISHLAVGTHATQIKTGSVTRSERLAKYNELIRINEIIGSNALYAGTLFQ